MGRMTSHILWKIKNVWKHQPDILYIYIYIYMHTQRFPWHAEINAFKCPIIPVSPHWLKIWWLSGKSPIFTVPFQLVFSVTQRGFLNHVPGWKIPDLNGGFDENHRTKCWVSSQPHLDTFGGINNIIWGWWEIQPHVGQNPFFCCLNPLKSHHVGHLEIPLCSRWN